MTTVKVRFFNLLAVHAGNKSRIFEFTEETTVAQMLAQMANEFPPAFRDMVYQQDKISPHLRIFLNERLLYEKEFDTVLEDGDSLMLFPAIAGG
ncbi:MAG: MoaD/ThiS family protein [Anaerolineales bacterium]|nr:MoaD/ThiS family protein [Anaerolineales bacterium]